LTVDSTPAVLATWEFYAEEYNLDLSEVLRSELFDTYRSRDEGRVGEGGARRSVMARTQSWLSLDVLSSCSPLFTQNTLVRLITGQVEDQDRL
jgi:hypothetical protein